MTLKSSYKIDNIEKLILTTIDHFKCIIKRKVSLASPLQMINKTSATNLDNEILKLELIQMITRKATGFNFVGINSRKLIKNIKIPN